MQPSDWSLRHDSQVSWFDNTLYLRSHPEGGAKRGAGDSRSPPFLCWAPSARRGWEWSPERIILESSQLLRLQAVYLISSRNGSKSTSPQLHQWELRHTMRGSRSAEAFPVQRFPSCREKFDSCPRRGAGFDSGPLWAIWRFADSTRSAWKSWFECGSNHAVTPHCQASHTGPRGGFEPGQEFGQFAFILRLAGKTP